MTAQPEGLISILLNRSARVDERDDAAMNLGSYDAALPTLIEAARNLSEDNMVAASLGASIGEIWERRGGFDAALIETLHPQSRRELLERFGDVT